MDVFHKIEPYPAEVLKLLQPEGFDAAFWGLWGQGDFRTQETCYQHLEEGYQHLFGVRKYADFDSFKRSRRHLRSKRRKPAAQPA